VTGLGSRSVESNSPGLYPVDSEKPVVSHHIQIYGLVHGVTTHESSATMSLYGYDLV
jgi:hypothetical protein